MNAVEAPIRQPRFRHARLFVVAALVLHAALLPPAHLSDGSGGGTYFSPATSGMTIVFLWVVAGLVLLTALTLLLERAGLHQATILIFLIPWVNLVFLVIAAGMALGRRRATPTAA